MSPFSFVGRIPASKSIFNRLLVIQSYSNNLEIEGESQAQDVRLMQQGLKDLLEGREVQCGQAGTVLRFLTLRASRLKGQFVLRGSSRLFDRPQNEMVKILGQLGVHLGVQKDSLVVEGDGWRPQGDTLHVPNDRSSQFISGVLLNSWNLNFDLYVTLGKNAVSAGYWRMTQRICEDLGLKMDRWDQDFRVPRNQMVKKNIFQVEPDMSSAFALAAVAAINGQASLVDFPMTSVQPDFLFIHILQTMGVPCLLRDHTLKVSRAEKLLGISVDLKSCPDLFPSLAVLCALAEGESYLYGAPHLIHKESDRIKHIAELIRWMGRQIEVREDGLKFMGAKPDVHKRELLFATHEDHRLAFAAAIAKAAGYLIEVEQPEVVEKSFPEFWQVLGWNI